MLAGFCCLQQCCMNLATARPDRFNPACSPCLHAESCGSLCATLAYMFVLAARGGVLDQLNETTIRTLVSMTMARSATEVQITHSVLDFMCCKLQALDASACLCAACARNSHHHGRLAWRRRHNAATSQLGKPQRTVPRRTVCPSALLPAVVDD